jgi:hypothetical protein
MKKHKYFVGILLILLCSCSSTKLELKDWNYYSNDEFNFSFKYPKDWTIKPGTLVQTIYVSEINLPAEWENITSLRTNFEA